MQLEKRNGDFVTASQANITSYIKNLVEYEPKLNHIDSKKLTQTVFNSLGLNMTTADIPGLIAELAAGRTTEHHQYSKLAGRACVQCLHKETPATFTESIRINASLFNESFLKCVEVLGDILDSIIVSERDYNYDIFAIKTLERSYLLKHEGKIIERPQYMLLRVSIAIALGYSTNHRLVDIIRETYEAMSKGFYTHATPTLFHAGLKKQQMASCYLMTMKDDSISGIYETLHNCALISKGAGGIGLSISQIRPSGSGIAGTNGTSNGLTPMLKVFNDTARYVDQCVVPETIIYTTRGPSEIQHLVNGESIIHENDDEPITNVLEHAYNGPLLHMKTLHSVDSLKITPEHPLFVLKDLGKAYNFTETKKRIENGLNTPDWVEAKNVQPRDFIGFPIPNYQKDQPDISPDDCYFYGLILGDGTLMQDKSYGKITIHTVEKAYIKEWLVQYFQSKCIQHSIDVEGNTTRVRWNKSTLLPIKYGDVYDGSKEKHVHHKWLHLPVQKCKYILKGLIDTDGSKGKELQFDSTSRNLIESVRYICLRMGVLTSGYVRDRRGQSHTTSAGRIITNKKVAYVLRIPKVQQICELVKTTPGKFTKYFEHNNMLYTRVQSIDNSHYEGVLYDLQMSKDHSYITHSGLIHNGGGKRKGSFAIWLEPWHPDVESWLDLKKNHGDENARARDLFYGLWVPDLFMKRVKNNETWSMFCPNKCPGLQDTWGEEFEALYQRYEHEGKAHATINAQELWLKICDSQVETGTPYLMYKDSCNRKSNQQNLGTIRSSNLCCEVVEYTSPEETAVCTLASLALPKCLAGSRFEYSRLEKITRLAVRNLNSVIDVNTYPVPEAEISNKRHRPIGIGIQGLHDVFQRLNMPYDSPEAEKLNAAIFETIYYAAVSESMLLAKVSKPYTTFKGSPASRGILQFDMWGVTPSTRYEWDKLKTQIQKWGLRNSLLVAPMPTASTAQILGNTESFEPRTSNLYTRRVLAGEYMVVNPHLQDKLVQMGVWNEENRRNLIANRGSVQGMNIDSNVKDVFKTVWEMSQKALINLSVGRSPYICQSQSLNLYLESPTRAKLSSMGFYAWSKGLKTGQYYLRSQPKARPIQFTVVKKVETGSKMECEEDVCIMCSS